MATTTPKPSPHGYFRRWIEGSDFSLEANTPDVPRSDRFFVLEGGEVRLDTRDYDAATEIYEELCLAHWEERLNSPDPPTRLAAARGLLCRNPEHPKAGELLQRQGSERDRTRVGKARQRAAYLRRRKAG